MLIDKYFHSENATFISKFLCSKAVNDQIAALLHKIVYHIFANQNTNKKTHFTTEIRKSFFSSSTNRFLLFALREIFFARFIASMNMIWKRFLTDFGGSLWVCNSYMHLSKAVKYPLEAVEYPSRLLHILQGYWIRFKSVAYSSKLLNTPRRL